MKVYIVGGHSTPLEHFMVPLWRAERSMYGVDPRIV